MEKLTQLAGAYVGGRVLKNFNLPGLIGVVTGDEKSSPKQAAIAQLFLDLTESPQVADAAVEVAVDLLKGRGVEEGELLSLIGSISPFVGVEPPKTRVQLVSSMRTVASRVVKSKEDVIAHSATVVCPKCKYVHAIES